MDQAWAILIYTVPTAPSRKRAAVWRAVKRLGAIYLRDGVCALPARDDATAALRAVAASVEGFGGEATLVEAARLDPCRSAAIVARSLRDRAAEYTDIVGEAAGFLEHIRRETAHRAFTSAEVEELAADLGKLRRWVGQVRARDYFGGTETERVDALLGRCDEALGVFLEGASHGESATP